MRTKNEEIFGSWRESHALGTGQTYLILLRDSLFLTDAYNQGN
jgi:hypothetical protein